MVRWCEFKKRPIRKHSIIMPALWDAGPGSPIIYIEFTYYIYSSAIIHIESTYYIYRVRVLSIWQRNLEHRIVGVFLLDYVDELLDDFGMLV